MMVRERVEGFSQTEAQEIILEFIEMALAHPLLLD